MYAVIIQHNHLAVKLFGYHLTVGTKSYIISTYANTGATMQLKDFLETIDYRITEGSGYQWQCFGPNAYCLDHWNGDHDGASLSVCFDKQDQTVYQVDAHDYANRRSYRWTNPEFVEQFKAEAATRGVTDEAYDEVNFIDLETEQDYLEKARAIFLGQDYDTRVSVPVDFSDQDLLKYMILAHERDITFNQLITEALIEAIDQYKRDPQAQRLKAQAWKTQQANDTKHCC